MIFSELTLRGQGWAVYTYTENFFCITVTIWNQRLFLGLLTAQMHLGPRTALSVFPVLLGSRRLDCRVGEQRLCVALTHLQGCRWQSQRIEIIPPCPSNLLQLSEESLWTVSEDSQGNNARMMGCFPSCPILLTRYILTYKRNLNWKRE